MAVKRALRVLLFAATGLAIVYVAAYVCCAPLIRVPAGTLVTPACSLGAPLGQSSMVLQKDTNCRVVKSYTHQVLFTVAFQVEALVRGGRLLLLNQQAVTDRETATQK